jgi:hypothetical protein
LRLFRRSAGHVPAGRGFSIKAAASHGLFH